MKWTRCAALWVLLGACTGTSPSGEPVVSSAPVPDAQAELDALDPRVPVPLQPMMAWHQKQNMHIEKDLVNITEAERQGGKTAVGSAKLTAVGKAYASKAHKNLINKKLFVKIRTFHVYVVVDCFGCIIIIIVIISSSSIVIDIASS